MERTLKYIIKNEYNGRSIRDFLTCCCHMSGTLIKELKRTEDGITVNGVHRFINYTLSDGDVITVTFREGASENILPVKMDFSIIYEDEDIIIVDKPPHMPTHPSHGNFDNTLANALMYCWQERGEEYVFRAVNRLDKDTSGIMCIAKNSHAHAILCGEIRNKTLKRRYKAIVCGDIDCSGTVDAPIMRSGESVIKRCVSFNGQSAVTHYSVIKRYGQYTLIELQLETGRTHQIRVHMSYIGHPLLGDWLYGEENRTLFSRQALHSCYLELLHPITEQKMTFNSELPADMSNFCEKV